jgi:hypothetical protein
MDVLLLFFFWWFETVNNREGRSDLADENLHGLGACWYSIYSLGLNFQFISKLLN